jgi:cytochrome c peroxidase
VVKENYPNAAAVGRRIFFDPSLSASGKVSCATCHDPQFAYAAPNDQAVQFGGRTRSLAGTRSVPSLRYALSRTPIWSKEFQANPIERLLEFDSVPTGGLNWDGRFDSPRAQAKFALLSPNEMANETPAGFVRRLQKADYVEQFYQVFGASALRDPEHGLGLAALATERFEFEDPSFYPYSSKFDDFLDGRQTLTEQEKHGFALFDAPDKGNCASCHTASLGADGSRPLFTDFGFEALGAPRNKTIPANARHSYFDLGLCGPQRKDLTTTLAYCGMFKTSSLRNAATRRVFFHNGVLHSLREVVEFYTTRDQDPRRWYGSASSATLPYDDLPRSLRGNVDHRDAPFNRSQLDPSPLTATDIDDLTAFLNTLTDRDVLSQVVPPSATGAN